MNTEEDTFKALKKIPFNEMRKLFFEDNNFYLMMKFQRTTDYEQAREDFLNKYGWTYDEYNEEWDNQ